MTSLKRICAPVPDPTDGLTIALQCSWGGAQLLMSEVPFAYKATPQGYIQAVAAAVAQGWWVCAKSAAKRFSGRGRRDEVVVRCR